MTGLTQAQVHPTDCPTDDELEITLFGSGYGESIVVHTGNNRWLLVDSSVNRDGNQPSALRYLSGLGVDISTQVMGVVVTHWHDDHVRGIGEIAEKCTSAKFYLSAALMCSKDSKKFHTLVLDSSASRHALPFTEYVNFPETSAYNDAL
jgi:glyoxylase-like metal-dependent hydrolase (beta-lactamase superfamily II)